MSFWLKDSTNRFNTTCSSTQVDEVVDVVVIGAGITGASTCYHLAKKNNLGTIVLLEKFDVSAGATGNNGGFICPGTSERFSASVERYGLEVTQKLFDYTVHCTKLVKEFVHEAKVDCELRFHGSVLLATNEAELGELRLSYEQLTSYGVPVEWWDVDVCAVKSKSTSYLGGMYKPNAGILWAAKLVFALVDEAVKLGVKVCTHTDVTSVERADGDGIIRVNTSRGVIRARKVVHCTNAWTRDLLPELTDIIIPVRNQLIMTAPMPKMWDFGLSANYGYEYFMQRPDGRILLGGMRDRTPTMEVNNADRDTLNAAVSVALRQYLPIHFPELNVPSAVVATDDTVFELPLPPSIQVENEWIGIMACTPDRNPLIGALKTRPNEYISAGYTGHGMPVAFLAGKNIADLIAGEASEVSIPEAYNPDRYLV